ncbi:hypothetical protein CIY_25850 [Butyrivibrio fibrisolvens 16/4]|nr:hypothetical protein CIY_25850 [Butyrivibrio fibrisolvens 16/4]
MIKNVYIPIKIDTILFYVAFFFICFYSIMESSTSSLKGMSDFRVKVLWIATVCCVLLLNEFFVGLKKDKYSLVSIATSLLIITLIMGRYLSIEVVYSRVVNRMIAYVFDLLVLLVVTTKQDRIKSCIKMLLIFCITLCLINDFVDVTGIVTFQRSAGSILKKYVVGTKFTVMYLHLNTLVLYITYKMLKEEFTTKTLITMYVVLAAFVPLAVYVDCSTGLIGAFVFSGIITLMFFGSDNFKNFIFNKYTFLGLIILATLVLFVLEQIVNIPFVANFIVNTLKRDLTLTGRLVIFVMYVPTMMGHWLWGYGLGSAYNVSIEHFGVADAQNLVLQWILQIGLVAVTMLLVWVFSYFARVEKVKNKELLYPIVALLYTYVFLGIGEITMNYSFFMYMLLLGILANHVKKVE